MMDNPARNRLFAAFYPTLAVMLAAILASACVSTLPDAPAAPVPGSAVQTSTESASTATASTATTSTAPTSTAPTSTATGPWSLPTTPISGWKLPVQPSAYMAANLPGIQTRTLANGVTLIIKQNPANRVFTMKLAFRGGSAMTSPQKAGIEAMTLALMARGSASYPYAAIQRVQYEKSSAIGYSAASYDWASFDLNTIDKYWDEMFTIFADCALNPAFDPAQFTVVQNDFKVRVQRSMADPYSFAVTTLHDRMFVGHPYAAEFSGNPESVSAITLEDIKSYYRQAMGADRLVVVAVGNFDADELADSLNATIGRLPRTGVEIPATGLFEPQQILHLVPFEKSPGVAYVRGDFPIADRNSPDFVTLQLAYSMLDELLFSIVRTEHGAAYSVWARAFGFASPYGSLVVYRTDRPGPAKGWVDEAVALLASGRTLNLKGGGDKYAPIASTIEAYKAKYINQFYGSQQTNAEIATQLATSYIYSGDHLEYLRLIDKITAIRPQDIVAAVRAYVVAAPISWIVVSDQATLDGVDSSSFNSFTGKVE
jgi:zinc protease